MINKSGNKWGHSDFSTFWSDLPCCLSKGPLKQDFLDIYLTRFFGMRSFGNTLAMRVIFFWKFWKYYRYFKNAEKNWEKVFTFRGNCIWIGYFTSFLLRREYYWLAVNVLKNSSEILLITKRDFSELNCFHSDQQIW